jgi:gliding motility-associated lipoprotein GldD
MNRHPFFIVLLALVGAAFVVSCQQKATPKPRGYFRIDFPERAYQLFDTAYPYKFEYPVYAQVKPQLNRGSEPYWIDVAMPQYKAKIHISYKAINGNLDLIEEDSRQLAYKHTIKADAINERVFYNPEKSVHGILYEIKGDAASSLQFYLTDSVDHFIRGSLYFSVVPNKDSLAPVVDFIKADMIHLMESFEWTK